MISARVRPKLGFGLLFVFTVHSLFHQSFLILTSVQKFARPATLDKTVLTITVFY